RRDADLRPGRSLLSVLRIPPAIPSRPAASGSLLSLVATVLARVGRATGCRPAGGKPRGHELEPLSADGWMAAGACRGVLVRGHWGVAVGSAAAGARSRSEWRRVSEVLLIRRNGHEVYELQTTAGVVAHRAAGSDRRPRPTGRAAPAGRAEGARDSQPDEL